MARSRSKPEEPAPEATAEEPEAVAGEELALAATAAEEPQDEPGSPPQEVVDAAKVIEEEVDLRGLVDMTYLGTSGRFVDRITGLTWEVGQTYRISSEDAQRIIDAVPQDSWEKVKAVGDSPPTLPEPEVILTIEGTPGF